MKNRNFRYVTLTTILSLTLGACGGGGGGSSGRPSTLGQTVNLSSPGTGGSNTTNNNTTTAPQSPQLGPVQSPLVFLTSEYSLNYALGKVNAAQAYGAGATGAGVTVAVIDTGIDADNPEFAGALHAASTNIVTGSAADLQGAYAHGTWVSGVLGARKNDNYTHGLAYNSTILAIRADTSSDSCSGCFTSSNIANGIRYAADNGARVINMSLGAPGSIGSVVTNAALYAKDKGALLVAAAGNEGSSEPNAPANLGSDGRLAGSVLAVGAVDSNNVMASYSNRAGSSMNYYLVAPGSSLITTDTNGMAAVSGTSFAAPMVSGAAALVLQAAPHLSGAQVADILLRSATDLGAAGTDTVYGRGMLNVAAALGPVGTQTIPTTSSAASGTATPQSTQLSLGAAFGDAVASASGLNNAVFVDDYGRGFQFNLGNHVSEAARPNYIGSWIASDLENSAGQFGLAGMGTAQYGFTADRDTRRIKDLSEQGKMTGNYRFAFSSKLTESVEVAASRGYGLNDKLGLAGEEAHASSALLKNDAFASPYLGFVKGGDSALGNLKLMKGLSAKFATGEYNPLDKAFTTEAQKIAQAEGTRKGYVAEMAYKTDGGSRFGLQLGMVKESTTALETSAMGAFEFSNGSKTKFVGVHAAMALTNTTTLIASFQMGMTSVNTDDSSLLRGFRGVTSNSFALGLIERDVFKEGDRLTFAVSQPMRVNGGSAMLDLPVGVNPDGSVARNAQNVGLTPTGRQLDIQAGYHVNLSANETLGISGMGSLQPGHVKDAKPELALGVRYTSKF